jgi:hypothetical protein
MTPVVEGLGGMQHVLQIFRRRAGAGGFKWTCVCCYEREQAQFVGDSCRSNPRNRTTSTGQWTMSDYTITGMETRDSCAKFGADSDGRYLAVIADF